jgi:hypothetical protein
MARRNRQRVARRSRRGKAHSRQLQAHSPQQYESSGGTGQNHAAFIGGIPLHLEIAAEMTGKRSKPAAGPNHPEQRQEEPKPCPERSRMESVFSALYLLLAKNSPRDCL